MTRLINPDEQFFDNTTGAPLALGTAYFGEPNQDPETNPKAVYADSALAVALSASQSLTAAGKPEQPIYLSGAYSLTVRDALGTLIFNEDYVEGQGAGLAQVFVSDVTDLLGFTPSQDGFQVALIGYHPGTDIGGGLFYWDASRLRSDHNGGTVISPGVPWDGTKGTLADFLAGTGESNPTGFGVFVRRDINTLSLAAFGVLADSSGVAGNGTDNSAALTALGDYLSGKRQVTVTGLSGIVRFVAVTASSIFALTSSQGVRFECAGTTLFDDRTYDDATSENANLFLMTGCKSCAAEFRGITTYAPDFQKGAGLRVLVLEQGCTDIEIDAEITGGLSGVEPRRASTDSRSFISSGIRGRLKCTSTHYPLNAKFSGDDTELDIEAIGCGRSFFVYGARNVNLNMTVEDQQSTSLIAAFEGKGVEDVTVTFYDRLSTNNQAAAPRIGVHFGDQTVATIRNLDIRLNMRAPATSPWGSAVVFNKYDNTGAGDAVERGHTLENVTISGVSDFTGITGRNHIVWQNGSFAGTDVLRNFVVRNFVGLGVANIGNLNLVNLSGRSVWTNVKCEGNIETGNNPADSKVVFVGCTAANFSTSASGAQYHSYVECDITDGAAQPTLNKDFINTEFKGVLRSTPNGTGFFVSRASTTREGDLSTSQSAFKVSPALGTGAQFRVKYYLVGNQADTNPASRDETFGIKTFSATMTTTGVWAIQQAVGPEVTERVLGTGSTLNISLVNGGDTGAFIAFSSSGYNVSGSRAYIEIEMLSMNKNATVAPI